MKKFYLIFLVLLSINAFSQTLEVPESKKALLFKATANWCAPCGYYHYITDEIYTNHSDNILFLNGHVASSSVGDPYSGEMHNLFHNAGGIPSYSLSGVHLTDWPPTVDMILDEASNFFASEIGANIAFEYDIVGDELTINTTTKFFQNLSADNFYVGALVVENNIEVSQDIDGEYEDVIQHRILRTVLGDLNDMGSGRKLWADEIAAGAVSSGSFFDHTLTKTLDSDWNYEEIEIIVVIWERNGDVFTALSSEDVAASVLNVNTADKLSSVKIYPNPVGERFNLELNNLSYSKVSVSDQLGRNIQTINPDCDHIIIDVSSFEKGVYFINIKDSKSLITKKIIVI